MGLAENIKRLREENNLSQVELGKIAGVSDKAVSTWEKGLKQPRMGAIQKIADHFGIQKSNIIEDNGLQTSKSPFLPAGAFALNPNAPRIPVLGEVRCGLPMYAEGNIIGYVDCDRPDASECFALRVRGDSMNAAGITDGDTLIIRRQDTVDENEIAVVCVNGDSATVKRFRQQGDTVILSPQSYNPANQTQFYNLQESPVNIIGRVMECRKSF